MPDVARAAVEPDTTALVHEAIIEAPVEEVWHVFSTGDGFRKLGVAQAKIDLRIGGKMLTHYKPEPDGVIGDEGTIENTILSYEPAKMIAFRITKPPAAFPFMRAYKNVWTVVTMDALADDRSRVRIACMGYGPDPEGQKMREFFDEGDAWTIRKLKEALERAPAAEPVEAAESAPAEAGATLAPIHTEAVVPAPVSEVWRSWTTSEGVKAFLTDANVELRVGGPFEFYFLPDAPQGARGSEGCTVLAYEPEKMLSFSWNAPPEFGPLREQHTWVVVRMQPEGEKATRVSLTHLGFEELAAGDPPNRDGWAEIRTYFDNAWPNVLAALVQHFEADGEREGERG
ncbi:MAG: SRPBCC domain-containing protein [Candidatus Eisenbacteria bacterium]|nr:SRPBCC domain-containing protein [Candidatus Eisenbacteria bacterium]